MMRTPPPTNASYLPSVSEHAPAGERINFNLATACAKGESDWRKRLAEARAIDEARELERRGLTLAPGRGC